jgi:hypothetical protein
MQERATERDLVLTLKKCREKVDKLEDELKALKDQELKAESALIELLEANGAEASAHYEGVGHFKLMKPRLYANVTKENQEKLFGFLAEINREDLIKTTVMPQTLSTFVKERIENGDTIPDFIGYYLKPSLRLFE